MINHRSTAIKSYATQQLEEIIRGLLDGKEAICSFNVLGQLEIMIDGKPYILSHLLEYQPDFSAIELTPLHLQHYAEFLEYTAAYRPNPRKKKLHPTLMALEIYKNARDHVYAINPIDYFIKQCGQLETLRKLNHDPLTLTQTVVEILLTKSMAAQVMINNKPHQAQEFDEKNQPGKEPHNILISEPTPTVEDRTKWLNELMAEKINPEQLLTSPQVSATIPLIDQEIDQQHELMANELTVLKKMLSTLKPENTRSWFGYFFNRAANQKQIELAKQAATKIVQFIDCGNFDARHLAHLKKSLTKIREKNNQIIKKHRLASNGDIENTLQLTLNRIDHVLFDMTDEKMLLVAADYVKQRYFRSPKKSQTTTNSLVYGLRTAKYAPLIIEYFKQFAKDSSFKKFCAHLTAEQLQCIQLVLLFRQTGQQGLSVYDTALRFNRNNSDCANHFAQFAKTLNISPEQITLFKKIINREKTKANTTEEYLRIIVEACCSLDTMANCHAEQYKENISQQINAYVAECPTQQETLNHLYQVTTDSLRLSGDQAFCHYQEGKIIDRRTARNDSVYSLASNQPRQCLVMLNNATHVAVHETNRNKATRNQQILSVGKC